MIGNGAKRMVSGLALATVLTGCRAGDAPATDAAALIPTTYVELRQATRLLENSRFSTLLDFEADVDLLFCAASSPLARTDSRAHTGTHALAVPAGVGVVDIKLDSLMSGRLLPGPYSLIGAYLWSDNAQAVTVRYTLPTGERLEHIVAVPANQWMPVMLDLTPASGLPPESQQIGRLTFEFADAQSHVLLDDLLLVDNVHMLVSEGGFIVRKRGGAIDVQIPNHPPITFKDADYHGSAEWTLEEWSPIRVRLSANNHTQTVTIYRDGRRLVNGAYEPLVEQWAAHAAEHETPATITVPREMGRLNRNTRGDANNDGYNETVGAYQVLATGARLDLTIQPTATIDHPVIEIAGLPRGNVLATLDGTLITETARLDDGRLLLILPGAISRSVTLTLRLQ